MKRINRFVVSLPLLLIFMASGCGDNRSDAQLLQDAKSNIINGQYRNAMVDLKNVLRAQPDNIDARLALGETMLRLGDADTSEKELLRAKNLGADPDDYMPLLASALHKRGAYGTLLTDLDAQKPTHAANRAIVLSYQGHATYQLDPTSPASVSAAEKIFAEVLSLDADPTANSLALTGQAKIANNQKDFARAELLTRQALGHRPDSIETSLLLGQLFMQQRKFAEAEEIFSYALNSLRPTPSDKVLLNAGLIDSLLEQGRKEDALSAAEAFGSDGIDHPVKGFLLGRAQFENGQIEAASETLQRADAKYPGDSRIQSLLGTVWLSQGQLEQAEMNFASALSAQPDNVTVRQYLAETRMRMDRPEDAMSTLRGGLQRGEATSSLIAALGRATMNQGSTDDAIKFLQDNLALNPNDPEIMWSLASAYFANGRLDDAEKIFAAMPAGTLAERHRELMLAIASFKRVQADQTFATIDSLLESSPTDQDMLNVAASFYISVQEWDRARNKLNQLLTVDNMHHDAIINLSRIDARTGNAAASTGNLERYLKERPNDLPALLALANIAQRDGDQARFLELIERANHAHPEALIPGIIIAERASLEGQFEIAENRARVIVNNHPQSHRSHATLAQVYARAGDTKNALIAIGDAIDRKRSYAPYLLFQGRLFKREEDYARAERSFQAALTADPINLVATRELAALAMRENNPKKALEYGLSLSKQLPNQPDTLELVGDLHAADKKYKTALSYYDRASEQRPGQALVAKKFRMLTLDGAANPTKPLTDWLNAHPDALATRLLLAREYARQEKGALAILEYEDVLQRSPKNVIALNNLPWLYLERNQENDTSNAVKLAEAAYAIVPDNNSISDTYGWMLIRNNQRGEGIQVLERSLERSDATENPDAAYHLAIALLEDGQAARAKALLDAAVSSNANFTYRDDAIDALKQL